MRKKIIAGNWKMNKDIHETVTLVNEVKDRLNGLSKNNVDVIICPPFTSLVIASGLIKGSTLKLGAQNMYHKDDGAYTGEISARMLKSIGCDYVILGHSERRQYFGETNDFVNLKVKQALLYNIMPIICVGETLEERESGVTKEVVSTQIKGVLAGLTKEQIDKIILAYEPVWAIGTGKNATPEQANEVHQFIRKLVAQLYSWDVAERLAIQYGGSVNPQNAFDLLSQSDIDGALVGGACLKAESFINIVGAATQCFVK